MHVVGLSLSLCVPSFVSASVDSLSMIPRCALTLRMDILCGSNTFGVQLLL